MTSTKPAERVARNIRAELVRAGMTQLDLATRVGLTRSALQRRLSGAQEIGVDELFAIAEALSVRPSALIAQSEDVAA